MKTGLFLKNWEVVAAFDMIAFVEYSDNKELEGQEKEVMLKLRNHILEVEKEWKEKEEELEYQEYLYRLRKGDIETELE